MLSLAHPGAEHPLVALPRPWDLFICAKDLLIEATHAPLVALLPPQQSDFRPHRTWSFAPHARLRASLAELDGGEFTEGHELDRKWRVPPEMI
jgi:hypothetical protein